MHMMSKSDVTHKRKETIRKSKESCTIITASGSITATEEATVQRVLVMFLHSMYLEFHQLYSPGRHMRRTWVFLRVDGRTITHLNPHGKITHCTSENVVPMFVLGVIVDTVPRNDADDSFGKPRPRSSQIRCKTKHGVHARDLEFRRGQWINHTLFFKGVRK